MDRGINTAMNQFMGKTAGINKFIYQIAGKNMGYDIPILGIAT